MNFLSFEHFTPDAEPGFTRVETLFINSNGHALYKTEWLPSCAQGRHVAREAGICRACEKEWVHGNGQIMRVHGWFNHCLKLTHDDAAVLLEQGWTLGSRTAEYSYLSPPEGDEDILIPLYEAAELPPEAKRSMTLKELPFLRKAESREISRIRRAELNAYKRLAPTLHTLAEHLAYLSQAHLATRPRKSSQEQS